MTDVVTYKLADCQAEREAAFRLVYERYLEAGLVEPNPHGIRVTPFHLLPTTDVVLAVLRGQVLYTVSLIRDADLGLQMEAIYGPEIRDLRKGGLRLAEMSCLANHPPELSRSRISDVFVNIVALTFQFARHLEIEQLLIAVHPKHERFYRRYLGFQRIGGERCYPAVCNKPAVACGHNFARLDRERYPLYDRVYGVTYSASELQRRPIEDAEREHLLRLMQKPAKAGGVAA